MLKVVIDSNLLVAALLTSDPASPTVRLARAAFDRRIAACTSPYQLSELVDVLGRPRFRRSVSIDEAMAYVGHVRARFHVVAGAYRDLDLAPKNAKNAKDSAIVAIAVEGGCKYVISDDHKHVLPLEVVRLAGHKPVQIVSLEDFARLESFCGVHVAPPRTDGPRPGKVARPSYRPVSDDIRLAIEGVRHEAHPILVVARVGVSCHAWRPPP